jgi:hypothetical protein
MTEESGGSGLTQKAIHPNVFRLNPDRLCEIAGLLVLASRMALNYL